MGNPNPKSNFNCTSVLFILTFICCSIMYSTPLNNAAQLIENRKKKETQLKTYIKNQPIEFLENKGQLKDLENNSTNYILFKAATAGVDLYVTKTGLSYVFMEFKEEEEKSKKRRKLFETDKDEKIKVRFERFDMELFGASIKKENIIKLDTGIAYYNFLSGPGDESIYHVKKYRKLIIKDVYPGIDWVIYNSTPSGFKYDFIVHAGANPEQIKFVYKTKNELKIDEGGNLIIKTKNGVIQENKPFSYISETNQKTESSFELISSTKNKGFYETFVKFNLPNFDPLNSNQTLVIDPQLIWATFYGGTALDGVYCTDTDPSGNVFMCGYTGSYDLPLLNSGGFFQTALSAGYVLKFNNTGTLIWSTFFGSPSTATKYLATDNFGNVFLCGIANTTTLLPTFNNGGYFQGSSAGGGNDAFITKFNSVGNMVWSTYYGGSGFDQGCSVATDINNNVFLVGTTTSPDFPLQNANTYFEPVMTSGAGFIVKFNNNGTRLWATYLKGAYQPIITCDTKGKVYLTGLTNTLVPLLNPGGSSYYQGSIAGTLDAYILKFTNNGTLTWGTYYGGSASDNMGCSIVTDKFGNVFVDGMTTSANFPVQNAGAGSYFQSTFIGTSTDHDMFILKFDSSSTRIWATLFGGSRDDFAYEFDNMTIDTCGNLFFGFSTESKILPFQQSCDGGMFDNSIDTSVNISSRQNVFLTHFSNSGKLMWSSYFGGDGCSVRNTFAADKFGNIFLSGEWNAVTNALSYPLLNPGGTTYFSPPIGADDMFIAKFNSPFPSPQNFTYIYSHCTNDSSFLPTLSANFLNNGQFSASLGLNIDPTSGRIYPVLSNPGTYTVNYFSAPCYCPGTSSVNLGNAIVSILPSPTLSISGGNTICVGEKATYTAIGAASYTWSNGPKSPTISITPNSTVAISYSVTGKGNNGCISKKTYSILVNPCTNVEEIKIISTILYIFPNPNKGEFTIECDSDINLDMVNVLGQVVLPISLNAENKRKVILSEIAQGIYFLRVKNTKEQLDYKIIVER
jgi:hypothetical protein